MRIIRGGLYTMVCLSFSAIASAELVAPVVNGFFALQEDEKRSVDVTPLSDGLLTLYADQHWSADRPASFSCDVAVPTRPVANRYVGTGRVAVAFYFMTPDVGSAECLVYVNDYPVARLPAPLEWQLRVIDLAPWEGQTVKLRIYAVSLAPVDGTLQLAFARLIGWHGPYYTGSGGLMAPGPHGRSIMPKADTEGRSFGSYNDYRIDPAKMSAPPLMLTQIDCIEPSRIVAESHEVRYVADFYRGVYWMALPLGTIPEARFGCMEGTVERGRVDIIPDFTAGDGPELDRMLGEWKAGQGETTAKPGG